MRRHVRGQNEERRITANRLETRRVACAIALEGCRISSTVPIIRHRPGEYIRPALKPPEVDEMLARVQYLVSTKTLISPDLWEARAWSQ